MAAGVTGQGLVYGLKYPRRIHGLYQPERGVGQVHRCTDKVPAGRSVCYTYPVFGERADVTGTWILTQFKEELSNIKFSQKWNEPLCKVVSSLALETFEPSWIEECLRRIRSHRWLMSNLRQQCPSEPSAGRECAVSAVSRWQSRPLVPTEHLKCSCCGRGLNF